MIIQLLAVGLVSILGQVVLLRELNVACFGSELIYILAFGFWLLGTAAGTLTGRRISLPSGNSIGWLLCGCCLLLPLLMLLARGLRVLLGGVPGVYLAFGKQLGGMALVLIPLSWLCGLLFQWTARRYVAADHTLARAYAIESAGGFLGGVLATLFLILGVSNFCAGLVCGLLGTGAVAISVFISHRLPAPIGLTGHTGSVHRRRGLLTGAVVILIPLLLGMVFSKRLDFATTAWNHPHLLETTDTPYGRITMTGSAGQVSVFENDVLIHQSEGTDAEEFAHLAALQHADPRTVLVLGGSAEGLVAELLKHRPDRIDAVELNGAVLDILSRWLPGPTAQTPSTAPVFNSVLDPRTFLSRHSALVNAQTGDVYPVGYDVILSAMPEPASGMSNRYYTQEFFQQCATCLAPAGVLALRIRTGHNIWTAPQAKRAASIVNALRANFPWIAILPGTTNLVFASRTPLVADAEVLTSRLHERHISARLVGPEYISYLYANDRREMIRERLAQTATATGANRDLRPICYQYTLYQWLGQFFPRLIRYEVTTDTTAVWWRWPWFWVLAFLLLAVGLWIRRAIARRRVVLAFAAGMVGMITETVLVLAYQAGSGALYRDLGMLLMLFMLGLALGAAAVDRWMRGRAAVPDLPHTADAGADHRRVTTMAGSTVGLLAAAIAWSLLIWLMLYLGVARWLPVDLVLLCGSGFLVAALFGYAGLYGQPEPTGVVSPLLGADLLGGCIGSLLATLLLVPLVGLPGTMLIVAGLIGGLVLIL